MSKVLKSNAIFERCLANADQDIIREVELNVSIANRICDILKRKGMTQRAFAQKLGKSESEISRWLTGTNGFTSATLSRMASALGEDIITITSDVSKEKLAAHYSTFTINLFSSINIFNTSPTPFATMTKEYCMTALS